MSFQDTYQADARALDEVKRRMQPALGAALAQQAKTDRQDMALPPPTEAPKPPSTSSTELYQPPPPGPQMPEKPHLYSMPGAPDLRPSDPMEVFNVFKNPAILIAGLGSLFSRTPVTAALKAATGAIEGYRSGNQQVLQQKQQEWRDAVEATLHQNEVELKKYNVAWDQLKTKGWQQVWPQLWSNAVANNDQIMQTALQTGDPAMVEKIMTGRSTAQEHLAQATAMWDMRNGPRESTLPEETINFFADQELAGDHSWKTGLGRGIQGKADIDAVMKAVQERAKERGMTGADVAQRGAEYQGQKSAQRTLGGYQAKLSQASNAVDYFADQALEASAQLPRGSVVQYNKAIQAYEKGTSDPQLYDLGFALFSLVNAYARAINPQGTPRIADKEHANEYLSTTTSPEALKAVIARLKKEVEAERASVKKTQEEMRGGATGTSNAVRVSTPTEASKLKPGTHYITPDGQEYTR